MITAGGVTSGIDFGLSVVAELAGETTARSIQLGIEYDPAPPFNSGHPDRAPADITAAVIAQGEELNFRAVTDSGGSTETRFSSTHGKADPRGRSTNLCRARSARARRTAALPSVLSRIR